MAINTAANLAFRNYANGFSVQSISGQRFQLSDHNVRLIPQQNIDLTLPNLAAATLFAAEDFNATFDARFEPAFDARFDTRISDQVDDVLGTQFTGAGQLLIGTGPGAYTQLQPGNEGQLLGIFGGNVAYGTVQQTPLEPPSASPTANTTMAPNMRYICNNAAEISLTLPANANVNQVINVMNVAGGVRILQADGQRLQIGAVRSTAGAAGYMRATADGDAIALVYVGGGLWVANTGVQGAWQTDVDDDGDYLAI